MNPYQINRLPENELSNQIIIPLLKKMGFKSVIYTCGIDEFGRDIVFYDVDKFYNKKWISAQVKAIDIHGTSSKSGNIQEIINQIQEGFDNPYFHPSSGEEIQINETYVITSGKITPKAKQSIKNKFKQKPVYFIDGQALVNYLEKYLPHFLEKDDKKKAIKERIKILSTSNEDTDIRELEVWFSEREKLDLDQISMDFVSSQIFKYYFKDTAMRYSREYDWTILSWLETLNGAEKILSKEINIFLENFPYYSMFVTPHIVFSFLKSLKKLMEISPKTYNGLKINAHLFFKDIKKSMEILEYPFNRHILVALVEESDGLKSFYDGKKIDLNDKHAFSVLIGMKDYNHAKSFLLKRESPERFFAKCFMMCVKAGVAESYKLDSNILVKFSEFITKFNRGSQLLSRLTMNYRALALLALGKNNEAEKLLTKNETYVEFDIGQFLPKAFIMYLGKPKDFFKKIENIEIPKIPEVYYEMSFLKVMTKNYDEALNFITIAIENSDKVKSSWDIDRYKQHEAKCLFHLNRYQECMKILEELMVGGKKDMFFDFGLYESCKKALKS